MSRSWDAAVLNNDSFETKKDQDKVLVLKLLVGTTGFEPATPCAPCKCATKLRYVPKFLVASRATKDTLYKSVA